MMSKSRHPARKNVSVPTPSPSFISLGSKERVLLRYIFDIKEERFNLKSYSKKTGIARSTLYERLYRLISKDLVTKPHLGDHKITSKGITTLKVSDGGVGSARMECRKNSNLSTHFLRYKIPITDRSKFSESRIKELNPLDHKCRTEMKNMVYYDIYFEDANVRIFPKHIIIRIYNVLSEDTEESNFESINKVSEYLQMVNDIGVLGDHIMLDGSHYARMESLFAEALGMIDNKYFLDLGNGRKFWIDNSPPNKKRGEDETNDFVDRERLDNFLKDMFSSDSLLSDINKMKEVVGSLIKLEIIDSKKNIKVDKKINVLTSAITANAKILKFQMGSVQEENNNQINNKLPDYVG